MRLADGVGQIGEQGKVQVRIAVGEEAHLELVDQFAHLLLIQKQRRHRDQRGAFPGNSLAEVELGQRMSDRRSR